jgi:uncharacterized protein YdhG (YjbR/CyaY superfamily)
MKSVTPSTIDEYIDACPEEARGKLRELRSLIRRAAPRAGEKISYKMPAFTLDGRALIYFACYAKHIGVYPTVAATGALARDLAKYESGKATLRFALDRPLPRALIEKVVRARVKETTGPKAKQSRRA